VEGVAVKARDRGDKRACECCGTKTMFVFEVTGKRGGHVRWADACVQCGEQPALTGKLK